MTLVDTNVLLDVLVLPAFMIGAHAVAEDCGLLTRDRGFYRDCFSGLRLA